MPQLRITGVSKTYADGTAALKDIELEIGPGMFGLLGPNGAGKSTLMRTTATLQSADEGAITWNGHDIQKEPDVLRKTLGYLPQEFGVYPRVTALELLDHLASLKGLGPKSARKAEVERLLTLTNLWDVRGRAVASYSGGMRQRFGIAQALLGSPELVIVDEPTAGLDPEERARFHNLLAEIGENVVVLLSTHIVSDVNELCGRVAVMSGGRIAAIGTPQEVTARLLGRLFAKAVNKDELAALPVLRTKREAGSLVAIVCTDTAPAGFAPAQPTLEDAYFAATKGLLAA